MRSLPLNHSASLLLLGLIAAAQAAEPAIPAPAFYLEGGTISDAGVPLTVPAKSVGKIEGKITADGGFLVFDGSGGVATFDVDSVTMLGNPFSVSVFVEVFSHIGYGYIVSVDAPKGIALRSSSHGIYTVSVAGEWNALESPEKNIRTGELQHVAVTCDGATAILYVDGTEVARRALENPILATGPVRVGHIGRDGEEGLTDVADHQIKQLAIFDGVLTPEQVRALSKGAKIPLVGAGASKTSTGKKPFFNR